MKRPPDDELCLLLLIAVANSMAFVGVPALFALGSPAPTIGGATTALVGACFVLSLLVALGYVTAHARRDGPLTALPLFVHVAALALTASLAVDPERPRPLADAAASQEAD